MNMKKIAWNHKDFPWIYIVYLKEIEEGHGIRELSTQEEKLSSNQEVLTNKILSDHDQIYNCDE